MPKKIRRIKTHIEAEEVEGLENVGWFVAITPKGVSKILEGSGALEEKDLDDADDVIEIRTWTNASEE